MTKFNELTKEASVELSINQKIINIDAKHLKLHVKSKKIRKEARGQNSDGTHGTTARQNQRARAKAEKKRKKKSK